MPEVRALAVAVIRRPGTGQLFVDEMVDPATGRTFHRLPGGGVEFGETARRTVERELTEEYGLAVTVGERVATVENLFTYDGRPGHEIVLVHEAVLTDPAGGEQERRPCLDQPHVVGVWRAVDEAVVPLYPAGTEELVSGAAVLRAQA